MKKILSFFIFIVLLSGCSTQSWKYTSNPKQYIKPEIQKTVVIPPLSDLRENENSITGYFVAMIPFVPYGTSYANIPEANPYMPFKPIDDFSKATAEELNNASIFKNVFFSHNIQDGDWYLQGNLIKSKYSVANTFYGLSLPGDLLWVLGLPSGKIKNEIEIEYKLMDKNYNIYFQKKYAESSSCYQGLYYNLTSFQFENLLKKINMRLIEDLHLIIPNLKKK